MAWSDEFPPDGEQTVQPGVLGELALDRGDEFLALPVHVVLRLEKSATLLRALGFQSLDLFLAGELVFQRAGGGRGKGALTGACFLELEAQPPELGVDFFNTFQETSRHFRQKWFEAADFCIFNVGGIGTLEEVGIELCNLKLGIRPRTPYVFFGSGFWRDLRKQFYTMIAQKRAPAWMKDYVLFTDDPDEVLRFYRKTLQVL